MIGPRLLAALLLGAAPAADAGVPDAAAFAALGDDAAQDLVILGETRPILLRLRVTVGDRAFRAAWADATKALHGQLDRDKDGKLTPEEAAKNGLAPLLAPPATAGGNPPEVDVAPKDGAISPEELAEALRATSGPFRLRTEGLAEGRTDALFDGLDRDKDGLLARSEMEAIVGSLRRLDRDADELIAPDEINPPGAPAAPAMTAAMNARNSRDATAPTVLELAPGESPVRLARAVIKAYDTGSSRGPGRRDSKLSAEEFAIPAEAFAAADKGGDGLLDAEDVRNYLAIAPRDAVLDVALPADGSGKALAVVRAADGSAPAGLTVRALAEGVVEIEVGLLRIDIHVDAGAGEAEATRKTLRARFEAADGDANGYLEESELTDENGQSTPLAALFAAADRDGDKKLYPPELDELVALHDAAARGRVSLAASNEGRALFGMLDVDRDRKLGAREVHDTFRRLAACDRDGDGRVSPEEVPHHIQLTLTRGDLSALLAPPANNNGVVVLGTSTVSAPRPSTRPASGPAWFRKMDRNRDGDVSRREFLGTLEQFERLDRDGDGLLAPDEADAAKPALKAPGG